MTVLATGATGTIGCHVVDQLLARGQAVRALSRDPQAAGLPSAVEAVRGDLTAPDSLVPALAGVWAMHLISIGSDEYAPLQTAPQLLARAAEAGVRRVTALTGTDNELGVADAIATCGLEWTHVRPVEFMANKLEWAESVRTEGVVRAPFAAQPAAIVDEADVAAVIVSALLEAGHSGRTYAPTGPETVTPMEAARRIGAVIGAEIRFVELTPEQMREQMRAQGLQADVIDAVIDYGADPPEAAYTVQPTVQEVTGRPARTFDQWVTAHADAFRPDRSQP